MKPQPSTSINRSHPLGIALLCALLIGAVATLLLPPAYAFSDGQDASLVLGQTGFTGGTAATSAARMSGPRGVAVDPASGQVFVADTGNNRVLRFASLASLASGASAEVVLGQSSFTNSFPSDAQNRMDGPRGVAVDSAGRLWVADTDNHRVLRFDNAASLSTNANASAVLGQTGYNTSFPNTAQNRMRAPEGVAVDGAGRLWVADTGNHRVLRFDNAAAKANGGNADGVLGQTNYTNNLSSNGQNRMNAPTGATLDSAGRLWVADAGNNRVLRFDSAASLGAGANASGLLGQANYNATGAGLAQNRMSGPSGVAVDSAGRLWVADAGNNRVLRFDSAASLGANANASGLLGQANYTTGTANRGGATAANSFSAPAGVAAVGAETLWVADRLNHRVLQHDLRLAQTITFAPLAGRQYGDAPFALSATASSGLAVSFGSPTPAVCTVSGATVTIVAAGSCTIAADQGGNTTYRPAPQVQQTFSVAQAPLTVSADDQGRAYGADNPALTFAVSGLVNGDTAEEALSGALATTATAASPVGDYPIAQGSLGLTAAGAANYTLSFVAGTLAVTPAALTVSADDQSRAYGADNPALTFAVSGLVNGDTAEETLSGALATAATAASPAGDYPIAQGTLAAASANYTLSFVAGTLAVTPAALTVSADDQSRAYGADNPALTFAVSGLVNGDTAEETLSGALTTTATAASPAGDYPIAQGSLGLTAAGAANYTLSFVAGTLAVTPATLTVTALDEVRKIGQPNPTFSIVYSGFVGDEDESVLTSAPTASTSADESSPVGDYPITVEGGSAANYTLVYVAGTLSVTDKDIPAIAWSSPAAIVYGTALGGGQLSAAASFAGQPVAGTFTYDPPAGTVLGAGSGQVLGVTFEPDDAATFTAVTAQVQIDVLRAPLAAAAANKTRVYGGANPALTFTLTGLVNGDTQAATLQGAPTTSATATSPVGSYAIAQGSLALTPAGAANYTLSFSPASLSVTRAPLTVRANDATRRVGQSNPAFTATYSGFVNGEGPAALGGSLSFATPATPASPAGAYDITPGGLTSGNYAITFVKGTLTVLAVDQAPEFRSYLPMVVR